MGNITRRDFLKISGGTTGLLAATGLFKGPLAGLGARIEREDTKWGLSTATICPYCAVGCGLICQTDTFSGTGTLYNIEGDPDHPINRGTACAKGAAVIQVHNGDKPGTINERRLQKVLYRAPGGSEWQEKNWDFALDRIAELVKKTRDESWIGTNTNGRVVNRTEAIASVGGAANDNEECYLLVKMLRAMGLVYIEHQARI